MAEAVPRNNIRRYKVLFNVGLLFHAVLLAPIVTKVVVEQWYGTPLNFRGYTITAPVPWEYVWSISSIFILCGFYAVIRENAYKLSVFIVGEVLFAVGPIIWSIAVHHHNTLSGRTVDSRWYAYSLLCLPVHCMSLYYASALRKNWKAEKDLVPKNQ